MHEIMQIKNKLFIFLFLMFSGFLETSALNVIFHSLNSEGFNV